MNHISLKKYRPRWMTVNYLALQKRNVGLIKNEFDHDQLFCNVMVVADQGWNSNCIMYY